MLSMWNMDYKLNLYFCFHSNTSFTILHFIDTYRVSAVLAVKLQTAAGCCGITFTTLEWRRLYIHPFIPPSTHPSLHLNVHRFPQKHRHSSNINNLNPQLFFTQTGESSNRFLSQYLRLCLFSTAPFRAGHSSSSSRLSPPSLAPCPNISTEHLTLAPSCSSSAVSLICSSLLTPGEELGIFISAAFQFQFVDFLQLLKVIINCTKKWWK